MSNRKYNMYTKLAQQLKREGYNKPGVLCSALLDAFIEDRGVIYAHSWVKAGLCEEGSFKNYRDRLVKFGWLEYTYNRSENWEKHQPGARLMKYINEEKASKDLLVTQKELKKALENLARNIIEDLNPPFTVEKLEKYLKLKEQE